MSVLVATAKPFIVPGAPPEDMAVAPNFERFDGLAPLDKPTGRNPGTRTNGTTPVDLQTYTRSAWDAVTGTVGGMPLPVADPLHRPEGSSTPAYPVNMQYRGGVGQANQGVAQTVQLATLANNPPAAGDLSSILAGWG